MKAGNYTPEDDALLNKLRAEGTPYKKIAEIMGRTVDSLDRRYRIINFSPAKLLARQEKHNLNRRLNREIRNVADDPSRTPEAVLIDRAARATAPKTLTQIFCGDPAPGWSALDRRRAGASA